MLAGADTGGVGAVKAAGAATGGVGGMRPPNKSSNGLPPTGAAGADTTAGAATGAAEGVAAVVPVGSGAAGAIKLPSKSPKGDAAGALGAAGG